MRNARLKKIVAASFALAGVISGVAVSRASTSRNTSSHKSGTSTSDTGKTQELKVTIKEWAVPTKGAHPHDPAVGAEGAVWFTANFAEYIGMPDPKTGEVKQYKMPVEKADDPHNLIFDANGTL